ncbi:MAG: terminase small subunit [Cyanobacteria bacterium J06648_10]
MARNPTTGLTDLQESFCREYLVDFNATAAYLRAGYKCKSTTAERNASRLLRNAEVQAYLQSFRDRVSRRTDVTLERTLEELGRVAFSDITSTLTFTDDGLRFRDSSTLPESVSAAIQSVSITEHTTIKGEDEATATSKKQLRMHDKVSALKLLATFFGIDNDFNQARSTLKRYGLALVVDEDSEFGWRLERHVLDRSTPTS